MKKMKFSILHILLYLYFFVLFFTPYYRTYENSYTESFILSSAILIICNIYLLKYKKKKILFNDRRKQFIFIIILILFTVCFTIANIRLECWYSMINQVNAFIFLYIWGTRICGYENEMNKVMKNIIILLWISVIFSILFRIIGGDAIRFYNDKLYVRYQGIFSDKRLTYVFNHKSEYGLVLLSFFMYTLYYFKSKYKKILLFCIMLGLILTSSVSNITCAIIILLTYLYTKYWSKCNKYTKVVISILFTLIILLASIMIISVISGIRDLSTLGSRGIIWEYAFNYLSENNTGIGKDFQMIQFDTGLSFYVNNFHNVFLNEMLQFSNMVGILYSILIFLIVFYSIFNYKNKIESTINTIAILLPLMFDHSLWTNTLPLYIVVIYMFGYKVRAEEENDYTLS